MLVGIVVILLGVATGFRELVPEPLRRRYGLFVSVLTVVFGVTNLVVHERGTARLIGKIDRYGTATDWQASEAILEVEGPETRKRASYALSIKVIPQSHAHLKGLHFRLREAHSPIEPAYVDDDTARWLYWVMEDASGAVDYDSEYKSGICTYYYSGSFDENSGVVNFRPDVPTYRPSLCPSLHDLEDKYVVARIVAAGVDHPMFTALRVKLEAPSGTQLFVLLPTIIQSVAGPSIIPILITSPERYIGGLFRRGQFVPQSGE
jgi:hypothetical protein